MLDLQPLGVWIRIEQRFGRKDLPWCADAALQSAVREKRLLKRMQPVALGNTFDGRNRAPELRARDKSLSACHRAARCRHRTTRRACKRRSTVTSARSYLEETDMPDLSWPLLDIGSVVAAHSAGIVGRLLMAWHHHMNHPHLVR
jgi:hypothetical protein